MMHTTYRRGTAAAAALMTAMLATPGAHADVAFCDTTFDPPDWVDITLTTFGNGAGSFASPYQVGAGGNPGSFRRIDMVLDAEVAGAGIFSLNINANAYYDPASQGAITQIDYTEDSIAFTTSGNVQGGGLLIVQYGLSIRYFIQRNPILVMPFTFFSTWGPNAAPGLVATDLWELFSNGMMDSTSNPDFSASGGLMQFGFWRGASSGNFVGVDPREAGIENWRVHVKTSCQGDINGDQTIDSADLLALLSNWGPCSGSPICTGCTGDLDLNGTVDSADLLQLLSSWGPCPVPCPACP